MQAWKVVEDGDGGGGAADDDDDNYDDDDDAMFISGPCLCHCYKVYSCVPNNRG